MADLAPARSRTDPPAPEASSSLKPHTTTHRLRASSFRTKDPTTTTTHPHRHRNLAKETVQSAIELKPPITFEHLLRRDRGDKKDRDSDSSRRPSSNPQHQAPNSQQQGQHQSQLHPSATFRLARVTEADVEKARKENELRDEDLRSTLSTVEEVGMSSTRTLDDTYYAILEKASILRSTVGSLQALVDESRKMHAAFQADTAKLEKETRAAAEGFGGFKVQEERIDALVGQMEASRGRTNALNGRLEEARLRVEAFEEKENLDKKRRRARFNITLLTLVGVGLVVVGILVFRHRALVERRIDGLVEQVVDVVGPMSSRLVARPTEDPYLRKLFDEL